MDDKKHNEVDEMSTTYLLQKIELNIAGCQCFFVFGENRTGAYEIPVWRNETYMASGESRSSYKVVAHNRNENIKNENQNPGSNQQDNSKNQ